MLTFNHFNFNVLDMQRSLAFYKEALGLTPLREKRAADGSYWIVFLQDEAGSPFALELTELRDRKDPYDLGEGEFPRADGRHLLRESQDGHLLHRGPGRLLDRDRPRAEIAFVRPKIRGPAPCRRALFVWFSPPRCSVSTSPA